MSSAKKAIAHSLYVLKDKERADVDLIFHIGSFLVQRFNELA